MKKTLQISKKFLFFIKEIEIIFLKKYFQQSEKEEGINKLSDHINLDGKAIGKITKDNRIYLKELNNFILNAQPVYKQSIIFINIFKNL